MGLPGSHSSRQMPTQVRGPRGREGVAEAQRSVLPGGGVGSGGRGVVPRLSSQPPRSTLRERAPPPGAEGADGGERSGTQRPR